MTFLEALHASRQRQAAREIERYRCLIDEANAAKLRRAIASAHAKASRRASSSSAGSSARDVHPRAWPWAILLKRIRTWAHAA
jgi:hypothetical protein